MSYITLEIRDDLVYAEVKSNVLDILSPYDLPLYLQVISINNLKIYETIDLIPGQWKTYHKGFRDKNFRIITKNNVVLRELIYDYKNESSPLYLYEFWDYFTKTNKNLTGLILGAGNGLWGEWVKGVIENEINCYLVEGSFESFRELKTFYGLNKNLILINEIISKDGAVYKFYDHNGGWNTIEPDYLINTMSEDELKNISFNVEQRKSKSLGSLLNEINEVNWIRFDLEGIDYDLIMMLNLNQFKNLKMVQYEHLGLSEDKKNSVEKKFLSSGYDVLKFNIDTIFLKK